MEEHPWEVPMSPPSEESEWPSDMILDEDIFYYKPLDATQLNKLLRIKQQLDARQDACLFEPYSFVYSPRTVTNLSAPTCATKFEADTYYRLANAPEEFKILDPATDIANDVFKASIIQRYRNENVVAASGVTYEVQGVLPVKRHHENLGEPSETMVADAPSARSGVVAAFGTANCMLPVLKRHREDPAESGEKK